MANKGRPRKNPALLEAQGAYDKNPDRRPDPATAIKVSQGRPEPTMLIQADELSVAIWNETCDTLDGMSILNKSDRFLIETYCLNLREMYLLTKIIREQGHSQMKDDGTRVTCPHVVSWHKCQGTHLKLMNELGLTPQARTRMCAPTVESSGPGDRVASLMEKLGGN